MRARRGGSRLEARALALTLALLAGCSGGGAQSWETLPEGGATAEAVVGDYVRPPASEELVRPDGELLPSRGMAAGPEGAPVGAPPSPPFAQAPSAGGPTASPPTATDAVDPASPLLVYEATLQMAVHQVEARQDALIEATRAAGGYLSKRTGDMLVVRVPAAKFEEVLAAAEAEGELLARDVQAIDVGEQYRDLHIRIRNLELMHERLSRLLERATDVDAALRVEQELNRITLELEQLRGQLRFLDRRIAFSTITVYYRPLAPDQQAPRFQLPFRWLHELGVNRLLSL